jgi:hypothetical protein
MNAAKKIYPIAANAAATMPCLLSKLPTPSYFLPLFNTSLPLLISLDVKKREKNPKK